MSEPQNSSNPPLVVSSNSTFSADTISQHSQLYGASGQPALAGGPAESQSQSPRLVTTGGNSLSPEVPDNSSGSNSLAYIDWLAFTITPPEGFGLPWLVGELVVLFRISETAPCGKGWYGYTHRWDLGGYGLLAYGGESQQGSFHIEINASGCARVADWRKVIKWGETYNVTITRVDLAHDDIEGKALTIAKAREWLDAGGFSTNGRPPAARLFDDLDSGKGKTLYVGSRVNGKLCRIYEKGRQLGDTSSLWTRVEVEFRNKSRIIPWDVLIKPGPYLAGAYPCLLFLSVSQSKIRTITKTVTISLASAVQNARLMVGNLVHVMMQVHNGDAFAVVNELKRDGIPRRLRNYADFLPQVFEGL